MDWQLVASYFTVKSTDIFNSVDNKENLMQVCDIYITFLKNYTCGIYQNRLAEAILMGCHNVYSLRNGIENVTNIYQVLHFICTSVILGVCKYIY